MTDNYITLIELFTVVLFLGAPVYLTAALCQLAHFRRIGLMHPSRWRRLTAAIGGAFLAAMPLALVFWALLPEGLLQSPIMRGDWPFMVGGVIWLPAALGSAFVTPVVSWLASRAHGSSPPNTRLQRTGGETC